MDSSFTRIGLLSSILFVHLRYVWVLYSSFDSDRSSEFYSLRLLRIGFFEFYTLHSSQIDLLSSILFVWLGQVLWSLYSSLSSVLLIVRPGYPLWVICSLLILKVFWYLLFIRSEMSSPFYTLGLSRISLLSSILFVRRT